MRKRLSKLADPPHPGNPKQTPAYGWPLSVRGKPNGCAADSALLVKLGETLADAEKGHRTSWLSNKPAHRPPTIPKNIKRRQAWAAAHMEQLMRRGLSREEAARKVFREIPRNSPLLGTKESV
jgi:hypothetical protein